MKNKKQTMLQKPELRTLPEIRADVSKIAGEIIKVCENYEKPTLCHECHREMQPDSSYLLCSLCAAKSKHNKD